MILDILAVLCIGVLRLGLRILIFARLKLQIFKPLQLSINLRLTKCMNLIVEFKVEIQDRSFKYFLIIIRVGESQFDLYMKVDTNTNGHRQWFYFSVRNLLPGTAKFNIYRFKKRFSLFQRGMKPYVRSKKEGKGWHPSSGKIAYRT